MLLYKIILQQQLLLSISFVIAYEISHHNLLSGNNNNNDNNNNNNNISFNISSVLSSPSSSSSSSSSSASAILSSSTRNDDLIYARFQQTYDNNEDLNSNSNIEYHYYNGLQNDINDFIKLIPIDNVQNVIKYYYNTDNDIKRALTYLESKDFIQLKDKIIKIQQMQNFLKYLNQTGFNVIGLLNTLVKLIGDPRTYDDELQTFQNDTADGNAAATAVSVENSTSTTTITTTSAGLHGLVDDILDTLPQDQILSLFFEKLETSNEFSNFIHNIGSEEFADILDSMEESRELRNLVYTLHNNGIFIGRIIDSLKAYFFLGTF